MLAARETHQAILDLDKKKKENKDLRLELQVCACFLDASIQPLLAVRLPFFEDKPRTLALEAKP